MKILARVFCFGVFLLNPFLVHGATTNLYHTNRVFKPITFTNTGATLSGFQVYSMATQLTEVVGPTNIIVHTNNTFAREYEAVAWGYEAANVAWTSVLANFSTHYQTYPGATYDNVGWIKGTRQAYGTWGGYLWLMQNQVDFRTSETNIWVSPLGVTNGVLQVLVGSIGDYPPMTNVVDVGPTNWMTITNFPGSDSGTDVVYKANFDTYYKLLLVSFTIYVDQPGRGGRDAYAVHINPLKGDIDVDVGHTFWRFYISDTNLVPSALQPFVNVNMGFYPLGGISPSAPETTGILVRPDDAHAPSGGKRNHGAEVVRSFSISVSNLIAGLTYSKNLADTPPQYDLNTFNCTDAGIQAGLAAGLHLPDPQSTWQGGGGSNPGAFGEELKHMPQ